MILSFRLGGGHMGGVTVEEEDMNMSQILYIF